MDGDTFSAYYLGHFEFEAGTYEFTATADDGVQVIVDSKVVIDAFYDQGPTTYTGQIELNKGIHTVEIVYYENQGGAYLAASWLKL